MTKNVLLVAGTEGFISHYHASSGKLISQLTLEPGNQGLVCDYSNDGDYFAVGCKDPTVKVYDENTKSLFLTLRKHGENVGHCNRICSLSFFKEYMIMTGGWDNNIYIWDIRSEEVVRSFHGVNLEGDSVDVFADHLLSIDCSIHDQMKVWSLSDGRQIFSNEFEKDGRVLKGYTAQYCKNPDSRRLFVGGSGKIQGYFMNRIGYQIVNVVDCLHSAIYCCDFSNSGELFVAGTQDGSLNLMRYSTII
jgi:WD40 repeat protein